MSAVLYYAVTGFVAYCALTSALFMLSFVVPRAGFFARCLAMYATFFGSAVFGVVSSIVLTLLGHQNIAQWATARAFLYSARLTTGSSFVVQDPADVLGTTRPAVFIGNHQTELDVLMLGAVFPKYCSVTAKRSLKHIPFLGWFMSLSGSIFIDRSNSKDARQAMQGAADEIKARRQSVYMFPEGTRSYTKEPTLLPFKKGAFHLAVQAGVPIVPCVVANYSHLLYPKEYRFNAGTVPIKVLDPIPTKGLTSADVDELARTTRELMLKELVTLTAEARGQPIAVPANPSSAKSSGVDVRN
ncbi:AtaAp protein [Cordyceps fumosorosea ARSEF 2679]|uniref:1-acyl-sn-glycerol-3-phosphate acyltransferase n=1 Tax=Cordyceps fumosorosea (strain ARSEF 2679) TaxID=1081104 RepID=A0A162IFM6_CORFA|nr:AtaAp protein [Cordyceps fumosorosea ARSEF 2679]OAA56475.1 AtaAp protein [Cordyceps fumosorosea ARSEF 2679]